VKTGGSSTSWIAANKRRGSRGPRIFRAGLTEQASAKHVSDLIQFLGGEGTESPHEVSYTDRLYLLEVEGSLGGTSSGSRSLHRHGAGNANLSSKPQLLRFDIEANDLGISYVAHTF
jgi:hypothetical protein